MSINNIHTVKEKIDTYLITSSITIIASFLIILSIKNDTLDEQPLSAKIFSIIAIISFIFSFIFSIWNKYRSAIREDYFEELKKLAIATDKEKLRSFLNVASKALEKTALEQFEKIKKQNTLQNKEDIQSKIKNELDNEKELMSPMIEVLAENISQNRVSIYKIAFKKPLKERHAKIKFIIDYVSQKARYFLFVIGLFSILIIVITNLIR